MTKINLNFSLDTPSLFAYCHCLSTSVLAWHAHPLNHLIFNLTNYLYNLLVTTSFPAHFTTLVTLNHSSIINIPHTHVIVEHTYSFTHVLEFIKEIQESKSLGSLNLHLSSRLAWDHPINYTTDLNH